MDWCDPPPFSSLIWSIPTRHVPGFLLPKIPSGLTLRLRYSLKEQGTSSTPHSNLDPRPLFSIPVSSQPPRVYGQYLMCASGDSSLLGLPTNDRNLLLNLVGAQVSSTTLFPCTSSITFNFGGSQNRNYTFPLVNTATEDQNGFCETTVADFGNTNHWSAGSSC